MGRILTDKAINFNLMRHHFASIWRPVGGVNIIVVYPQLFLFHFFHAVDLKRVSEGGPWSFDNCLLILHKLGPGEVLVQVPLFHTIFWVHVYDLPPGFMSINVGKQIGELCRRVS